MDREYFLTQLRQQLDFLERSCALFDELQYENEAIRMAVVIRTIFHQTKNSKSIIAHLGNPEMKLPSYIAKDFPSDRAVFFQGLSIARVIHNKHDTKAYLRPILDEGPPIIVILSFIEWWNQIVWVSGSLSLTRKELVLFATNKDGGAHVDASLPKAYAAFIDKEGFIEIPIGILDSNTITRYSFKNAHYSSLRQIAWEVLNGLTIKSLIS